MKPRRMRLSLVVVLAAGLLAGCSHHKKTEAPDVTASIRNSFDQAGLKDVTVSQNRDKGVVTLGGHVATGEQKTEADTMAKIAAGSQVVADQIEVAPAGTGNEASTTNSDLDAGIKTDLSTALEKHRLNREVKFDVRDGVVTLTGNVGSQVVRSRAEKIASSVPNVTQVVNEVKVKGRTIQPSSTRSSD